MTGSSKTVLALAVAGVTGAGAWWAMHAPTKQGSAPAAASPPAVAEGTSAAATSAPPPMTDSPLKRPPPSAPGLPPAPTSQEDLAPLFARKLAALAEQDKLGALAEGNLVKFDVDAIALLTRIEHEGPAPNEEDKRSIGIAVEAIVPDDGGRFHFIGPAIGVGRTRAEAIEQAIGGWLGLSGKALLEAVPRRAVSRRAIPFGQLTAYPGAIAIRGEVELTWTPRRDDELLTAVAPGLGKLDVSTSHSLALTLVVLGGGAVDGQCLVDNHPDDELCKLAKKFDWPASAAGYMARQVYLLRPKVR